MVAKDAASRHRVVQLPAHGGLRRPQGRGPHACGLRRPQTHLCLGRIRARQHAGLPELPRGRRRAATRHPADPAARRRVRGHQGGRDAARPLPGHGGAGSRLLYALPRHAAESGRPTGSRRPALFRDRAGAENLARDPAVHVDGPGCRRRGRARTRPRHQSAECRGTADLCAGPRARRRSRRSAVRQRARPGGASVNAKPLPLDGIKVIDFTQVMMGPCATQMLADYGADVIKIERPGTGDLSRTSIPNDPAGLVGPVFCSLNRNKRSIVLDTRKPEARDAALRLIERSDIVVSNFRAGVMDRMGFGYEALARLNPRLIYAVGTGYGLTGPYAHKGGQDVLAQAMSGVMARRSDPSVPLALPGTAFADYAAGMHLRQR